MYSHFGYKILYLFQLLLIWNLEYVLGLNYPFPTPTSRWWPGRCQEQRQQQQENQNQNQNVEENPGVAATRRVFLPSLRVHRAAIRGGGPLLAGVD